MAVFYDLKGTTVQSFQIQKGGARIVNNHNALAGLHVRNAANGAYADLYAASLLATGNSIVLNADAAGAGADWTMTLSRPAAGMTANVDYIFPAVPAAGQVLSTDVNGVLSWVSQTAVGSDIAKVASKAFGFASAASFNAKLIPLGAIVLKIEVVIDTPFDTAATLEVGIAGTTDKYMATTENDLQATAKDVFDAIKGNAAVGGAEQIICTYTANGAGIGAGRVLVHYVVPETL